MSTEMTDDNFAGMSPEQKVKALVLLSLREIDDVSAINTQTVDELYDAFDHEDQKEEIREGHVKTDIRPPFNPDYESHSVAGQLPDGSWVGWTYWFGGGTNGTPWELPWMKEAYHVDAKEEQKMVTVRTFARAAVAA